MERLSNSAIPKAIQVSTNSISKIEESPPKHPISMEELYKMDKVQFEQTYYQLKTKEILTVEEAQTLQNIIDIVKSIIEALNNKQKS